MPLDLQQSKVDPTNPLFIPMLRNLQANIVKGHGRDYAHHLFFAVNDARIAEAKAWFNNFATTSVVSAFDQLEGTRKFKAGLVADAGPIITLSLTAGGYGILGQSAAAPADPSFQNGMQGSAAALADDSTRYEEAFLQRIHFLVIVADDTPAKARRIADDVIAQVGAFGRLIKNQRGNILKTKGTGIEHFGYADGISQPMYLKDEIESQLSTTPWNDETNLDLLLVPDPGTDVEDCFGSYLVFRKLEQDVQGFHVAEKVAGPGAQLPGVREEAGGAINEELPGAMLVGRFENGMPVTLSASGIFNSSPAIPPNHFDYHANGDEAGLKCPFHSHIRLMNPRTPDLMGQRITRRGIPFDDVARVPENEINDIPESTLENNLPETGVGLLFMCYQSSIASQFEILQQFWVRGNLGGVQVGGAGTPLNQQDSLINQDPIADKTLPLVWGEPQQSAPFGFRHPATGKSFVTLKGGEYFFTPSIRFLATMQ